MDINIKLRAGLALFGVVQGVFLSLLLFFYKRGNPLANRLLAILIFLFSMRLAEFVGYWTNFFLEFPHLAFTTVSVQFLFGPLLYLYAKSLTEINISLKRRDFLHFLPFVLELILLAPFYFKGSEYKIIVLKRIIYMATPIFTTRFFIVEAAQNLQMLIYTILTLNLLKRYHQRDYKGSLSFTKLSLKWLRNLSFGFAIFVLLDFGFLVEIWLFGYQYVVEVNSVLIISSAILIYCLGYFGFRQPEVFMNALKKSPQYEKSTLSDAQSKLYLKKLFRAMEEDKLFTDNDLNLQLLAQKLAISLYYLSQIINVKLHKNFFDFINRYRIEEAKKVLSQPQNDHTTILSIAYEVGFNNKTSFNTAFKKHTNITPSQFRNSREQHS